MMSILAQMAYKKKQMKTQSASDLVPTPDMQGSAPGQPGSGQKFGQPRVPPVAPDKNNPLKDQTTDGLAPDTSMSDGGAFEPTFKRKPLSSYLNSVGRKRQTLI